MNYIFEIIQAELLLIYIICSFTDYKITIRYYFTLLICLAIVIISHKYYNNSVINLLLSLTSHLLPAIIGIRYKSLKKLLYTITCCISFSSLIYSLVFFVSGSIREYISSNRLVEHTICFVLLLIVILLLKNKLISKLIFEIATMSVKIKTIILLFILELITIITGLSALFSLQLSVTFKITISLVLFFTILVSFTIVFLLISENLSNSYYSKYSKIMREKIAKDAKYIEKITLATENLRHLKHDVKNMILGINTCLNANDIEGAKKYLDDFNSRITPPENWIHTGNPFLNSLLSDKYDKLTLNNIKIKFNGLMPTESIKPVDICIVFGNALDNAIESCEKLPIETIKTIEISIKQQANILFVSIVNPIANPVKIRNNTIISSKNSSEHGIGIYSMNKIVQNYNGQLILKCDEEKFTIEMSFALDYTKTLSIC